MSEAPLTEAAALASGGATGGVKGAGFVTKQTPLEMRQVSDKLPSGALGGEGEGQQRCAPHRIEPEGDGVEALMEPLRQHDPEERLRCIADAQAETEIAAAKAHAAAVKAHSQH
ncbi:hypothetical protein ABPG77_006998 [Micractinium sp. CCAP 211/92]